MIQAFLDYLKNERNSSLQTVKSYEEDLRAFESFFKKMDANITWLTVDTDVIRDWLEQMMDNGNKATSVNRRLSAVRGFYRYALRHHLVERDPAYTVTGPKKERPLPYFVKEREMDQLLDERMWNTDSYKDVRARTILLMFYETGLRVSELINLDDKQVDFVNMQLKVTGKGDKQRLVPFGQELASVLADYIGLRNDSVARQSDALFLTENGQRMVYHQVRQIVKKQLGRVTTMKKRSPHVLRHTFATAMLNHEAGLESVKKLLGHQSLSTTEVYTHTTFEQLKKVYSNAHPRAEVRKEEPIINP